MEAAREPRQLDVFRVESEALGEAARELADDCEWLPV